jgi:hypothetical protein
MHICYSIKWLYLIINKNYISLPCLRVWDLVKHSCLRLHQLHRWYLPDAGTSAAEHNAIAKCLVCAAGTWSSAGAPSCTNCIAGTIFFIFFSPIFFISFFVCILFDYRNTNS